MDGFGELFKAFGEMISGAAEEGGIGEVVAGALMGGEARAQTRSATETYDRVLAGRRRELNVNDR
jgi:hypothetical protein